MCHLVTRYMTNEQLGIRELSALMVRRKFGRQVITIHPKIKTLLDPPIGNADGVTILAVCSLGLYSGKSANGAPRRYLQTTSTKTVGAFIEIAL